VEITEQALIEEFDRRNIPISKRVLTDWRAKGYLPPLQVKGLGQGKGKTYFWSDTEVIEQALLVDEALQSNFRGKRILITLWLFGYDLPSALIREHLLDGLGKFAKMARGENQGRGAIEEHIDDLTVKYYSVAAKYPQLELPGDMPPAAMEMVLNIFVNPTYDLTDAPFEDGIAASLEAESKGESGADGTLKAVSHDERARDTQAIWRFVHDHFSLSHIQAALTNATSEDLRQAQTDIKFLFDFVGREFFNKPEIEKLRELRVSAAYSLGILLTIIDLTLRRQGLNHLVDQCLSRLEAHQKKGVTEPFIGT
jgi:hypothetical protein